MTKTEWTDRARKAWGGRVHAGDQNNRDCVIRDDHKHRV